MITTVRANNHYNAVSRCHNPINEPYIRFQDSLVYTKYAIGEKYESYWDYFVYTVDLETGKETEHPPIKHSWTLNV